jgi:hypothetical protein
MKALKFTEEIELLDAEMIKRISDSCEDIMLAFHCDGSDNITFCDADDVLAQLEEYIEISGYETREEAEEAFWESVSISKLDNYIKSTLREIYTDFSCVEKIVDEKTFGYALLFHNQLDKETDDRDALEEQIRKALPEAELKLFWWKNGRRFVEAREAGGAECIEEAVSEDIFADDDRDWLESAGADERTQGICYDSAYYRLGWLVPSAESGMY